jgi:hypothetical protein
VGRRDYKKKASFEALFLFGGLTGQTSFFMAVM